jgi:hypothetical protein
MEEDDSRPGPTEKSDKVSGEELQSSKPFHCIGVRRIIKSPSLQSKELINEFYMCW